MEPDVEFVRLAYRQDRDTVTPWDGYWHLAGFAIPESSRKGRDALRTRVVYLGGALVQGGLYVSPHAWEPYIRDAAAELDVEQHLSSLTTRDLKVGTLEDPVKIAAQLWPLDQIADGYERLLDVATARLHKLQNSPGTDAVTMTIELAAEFTRAMEPDPLLPPELLPTNWIGTRLGRSLRSAGRFWHRWTVPTNYRRCSTCTQMQSVTIRTQACADGGGSPKRPRTSSTAVDGVTSPRS